MSIRLGAGPGAKQRRYLLRAASTVARTGLVRKGGSMSRWLGLITASILLLDVAAVPALSAAGDRPGSNPAGTDSAAAVTARQGVCPPFFLRDEAGRIINPITGENADQPYSPKQTCGGAGCHNYDLITQGFHFQQGADEQTTADQAARCQWASTPGLYGGTWCSPGPLYRSLAPKRNASGRTIDMTSFGLITAGCAKCHPGGGPLEYDRDGYRYDERMRDPAAGLTTGGDNNFDGDYYKARWSETGVLEADCLLCHLPEYNFAARNAQLDALNFRWAPTAGAGLGEVTGAVAKNETVAVAYDASKFNPDGTLSPHIVVSPRNETCLACHAQPGWKKRGANFRARTDVHLRAGLRCVDCHPAGSRAIDPRVRGREVHQFGKGDDPGGQVRNDLDNTVRDCADCHTSGYLGAPIAEHRNLPPLHLERIACQTCHIPERVVMPIQVQASDVFNPAPKIPPGGKQLWTFYGVDGDYRNHYGYLEMMGYDDKPTEPFRPMLTLYKDKIYPVNRVHTAWPGIEEDGKPGLAQPLMSDIRKMWTTHRADPTKYPRLAEITDDNGDGVIEVNRPEEIDALIASVTQMLTETGWPMEGKRVVWVMNDRVYTSGTQYHLIPKHDWEASPYGNVHKYSHDVYPAKAALGTKGCTECHAAGSPFFFAAALEYPFDEEARPVTRAQYELLGYRGRPRDYTGVVAATQTFFRWLTIIVMAALIGHIVLDLVGRSRRGGPVALPTGDQVGAQQMVQRFNAHMLAQHFLLMVSVIVLIVSAVFLFGLRYPGAAWAAALTGALGGVDFWRVVHRCGAALLIITAAYHLVYLIVHADGRRDFVLLLPRWQDFRDFGGNLLWYLGLRRERPAFGRFTYFEKFDYWAVFWGCVIMIGTGLAMWFPALVRRLVPSASPALFDAFKEAHAHEAVLALLAIAIWHVYNVHLRPGRFPGSLFWMHGRISRAEMEHEHPAELRDGPRHRANQSP